MTREQLYADLERDEGLRLMPYTDTVGKLTIGVGRNLSDNGIGHAEALMLLKNDVAGVEADLDRALPWWRELTPEQQRGLANMCFNLGITRLLKFEKMLAALHRHDGQTAAVEALDSTWAKQVGARAGRISKLFIG
ncbi:MAG: hypothetical protein NUW01_18485 [Gemmatimonadaceae bacterium]|nr:hypothetical protein [Gemmatimonadaceae bacterium]